MTRPSPRLVAALRATADRLADPTSRYQWGHMGGCNCGHLAQTVTKLSSAEIHRMAMEKAGDWGEQAVDHCPTSGYPLDHVIAQLLDLGLTRGDLEHLEELSDPTVLAALPGGHRYLKRNARDDVVLYLRTWAMLLDGELPREARLRAPTPARPRAVSLSAT